jgi:hypothetical protein
MFGGVATSGLMTGIANLFGTDDGRPVVQGIPREVMVRVAEMGGTMPDWENIEVPSSIVEVDKLQIAFLDIIEGAGVDVLLHALAVDLVQEDERAVGVVLESPSGRQTALGKCLIDATGDAVLAAWMGSPFQLEPASGSLEFLLANVDLDRTLEFIRAHKDGFPKGVDRTRDFETFERNWVERGFWFFPHHGGQAFPPIQELIQQGKYASKLGEWFGLDAFGMLALRGRGTVQINSNFTNIKEMDVREFTRAEIGSRRMAFYTADFLRNNIPGFENAYIVRLANEWGQRCTRWIIGEVTLTGADTRAGRKWDDVIGLHPVRWATEEADCFEMPYRVMVPKGAKGALVASGKSASTDPAGLLRLMPSCMTLGQAAGVAAAFAAEGGVSPDEADITEIQRRLMAQGVYLGDKERLKELGIA